MRKIVSKLAAMVVSLGRDNKNLRAEVERLKEENRNLLIDPLTKLGKREALDKRIASQKGDVFSIGIVDADGLKAINDTLGHNAGDDLIRGIADHIKQSIRKEDVVFRTGGDEFAIIFDNCTVAQMEAICERMDIKRLSWGVAMGKDFKATFQEADELMYIQKLRKKGTPEDLKKLQVILNRRKEVA